MSQVVTTAAVAAAPLTEREARLRNIILNLRQRKAFDYNRHYKDTNAAVLEHNDYIVIEPFSDFNNSHFKISPSRKIEVMPEKFLSVASNTATITAMTNGTTAETPRTLTELELPENELGQWKLMVFDPSIEIKVFQPATTNALFSARDGGPKTFNRANTFEQYLAGNYAVIPEIWTFQNSTPVSVYVASIDPNKTIKQARLVYYGWKYKLDPVQLNKNKDPKDPRVVTTIDVGKKTQS